MAEEVKTGIQFEDIAPWIDDSGDTGLSARLKLKRNFEKIKAWMDSHGITPKDIRDIINSYGRELFLQKDREDATSFLTMFLGGMIADLMIQSPEFKLGEWSTGDDGMEQNSGKGFSIWKNAVDKWITEIDYATVRHLLRAREIYARTAHLGEVTNPTVFKTGLQTLGNILIGKYTEGAEGGIITPEGRAEIETLVTRGLARLGELAVEGSSTFGGSLSSTEFISAFLGGKGWAIQKKTRTNAAGVEEDYYTLEIDSVTVRETLRVYEMVVSQLRGEFDNYVFAAMMEVHHYDPLTGRVWLSTECGKIKAVAFRKGDYIKVQQYEPGNDVVNGGDGYVTKSYELIVTKSGTGGMNDENGDRLDWVTFKNFTTSMEGTAETLIGKKDTFVRIDNETDPERKGLMQIMTVGPNTPYQDVHYGMKTDPNDALKVRLGNLQGLVTELFGQLEQFGAYLPNLYAVGKMFNRQTGESFSSSLEITRERLRSVYSETVYNVSEEDNFLTNGFFTSGLDGWTACTTDGGEAPEDPAQQSIDSGNGTPLMVNGAILAYQSRLTARMTEWGGMRVLHLLGMGISQDFSNITANSTHKENVTDNDQNTQYTETKDVADTLYMGVRMIPLSSGTLTASFLQKDGSVIASWSRELNASREWQLVQAKDSKDYPWAYTGREGRMILSYTGECYIRFVALRTDPVENSRETYSTMIEQTSRRITLEAKKQTADLNEAVAQINIQFDNITQTVTDNKTAAETAFSGLKDSLDAETAARQDLEDAYHATWVYQNDTLLSLMSAQFNSDGTITGYADLKLQVEGISTTVTNNKSAADTAFEKLTSELETEVGDRKSLEDAYHATWTYQNDTLLKNMAAEFDENGNIKGYSELKQTVSGIQTTVATNKKAADDAFATLNETTLPNLKNDLGVGINQALGIANKNASWISQHSDGIELVTALFNEDGTPTEASGLLTASNFATLFATELAKDGTVMKKADMGVYVTKTDDGYISNAFINADNVKFSTFDWEVTNPDTKATIFHLDSKGNLTISGTIYGSGGQIAGWMLDGTRLRAADTVSSIEYYVNGGKFIGMGNYDGYSSSMTELLRVRNDGAVDVYLQAYDGGTGLQVLANTGSTAIASIGPCRFNLRDTETFTIGGGGKIILNDIPTWSYGMSTGQVYRDGDTLKIVV